MKLNFLKDKSTIAKKELCLKPKKLFMKKVIFIFSFLMFSCTKNEKKLDAVDYIYNINFYPSFADRSEVEITKIGVNGRIKLTVESEFSQVIDSTVLNEEDFKSFSKALGNISLANMKGSNYNGIDGMTCSNVFYQNGKLNKFSFWSPPPNTKYYILIDAVISIMKRKFIGKNYDEYFERLDKHYKR